MFGDFDASTPSAKTPGRVSSLPGGGALEGPNRSKGSAVGAVVGVANTRKVCWHLVQRTLTPFSVTLSSGILKRVWHCSHLTIIGAAGSLACPVETRVLIAPFALRQKRT